MENEQKNESEKTVDDNQYDAKQADFSQAELISQWRKALASLKKDVEFDSVAKNEEDNQGEQLKSVREDIAYLDNKNTLLDENDDFILSDSGFLIYQTKHMAVFDYLSQLVKPFELETKSKFYFISREKHITQKLLSTHWAHSLIHFVFIFVVIAVIGIAGTVIVVNTQYNLFIQLLLFWFCVVNFKTTKQLIGKYRKAAKTPFRFNISLLGIHCVNILLKVFFLCFIPILIAINSNLYWVDDIVIISLFFTCLINFKLVDKLSENNVPKDLKEVEAANV